MTMADAISQTNVRCNSILVNNMSGNKLILDLERVAAAADDLKSRRELTQLIFAAENGIGAVKDWSTILVDLINKNLACLGQIEKTIDMMKRLCSQEEESREKIRDLGSEMI